MLIDIVPFPVRAKYVEYFAREIEADKVQVGDTIFTGTSSIAPHLIDSIGHGSYSSKVIFDLKSIEKSYANFSSYKEPTDIVYKLLDFDSVETSVYVSVSEFRTINVNPEQKEIYHYEDIIEDILGESSIETYPLETLLTPELQGSKFYTWLIYPETNQDFLKLVNSELFDIAYSKNALVMKTSLERLEANKKELVNAT